MVSRATKVISFDRASEFFAGLRAAGKKIVQCHDTFDFVHPAHIVHFEEAKTLGDVLVVTVTGENHVNKNPGRPYFNDQLRTDWISAFESVDHVVIIPFVAVTEAIECVRPHVYCKSRECADTADVATVRRCGGEVSYVGSAVSNSSRLLNNHFETHSSEVKSFCRDVAKACPTTGFGRAVEDFAKLRVLIVGDIIFDRYTTLDVQGLTSKNRILSGRFVSDDMQAGGALAVYRHIREFTPHVKLISLVGAEPWLEQSLASFIPPDDEEIVRSPHFTTVVKQRFVEPRVDGKELSKLFAVNFIDKRHPGEELQRAVIDRVAGHISNYDLVIVMDFGHGLLEDAVRDYVQNKARFLAVNCQTNSNNHGFNILNRRYRRADALTLDQTEITLAVGRRAFDFHHELSALGTSLRSQYAWLTRGASETLGWNGTSDVTACSPFERAIVDTLGAGDAFCSVAFLAAACGLPMNVATFMGQLAGAQAVQIVGNGEPICKAKFLKRATSMLAF